MKSTNSNSNQKKKSFLLDLLIWISLAILLRWQIVEPRWIPSGSMLPTLRLQDRILVEKIRPRLSRTYKAHLNHESIVVFKAPKNLLNEGYSSNTALIKRVVGLPGDQIAIHEGNLYRNGIQVKEPWRKGLIQYEMNEITVPKDSLWVLGDNRNNSLDSHLWGPLPEKNVIGTAIWRYWPLDKFGPIRFPTH